jgi:hypothetical protein
MNRDASKALMIKTQKLVVVEKLPSTLSKPDLMALYSVCVVQQQ